ncbi:pre-rRNA-proCES [Forsythia ovata]|uniref:Pre-rRNA-proCES n=1 Tax=Forsythia ovata TaxID=205694 RepID=A0ABD1TAI1_9LAMI
MVYQSHVEEESPIMVSAKMLLDIVSDDKSRSKSFTFQNHVEEESSNVNRETLSIFAGEENGERRQELWLTAERRLSHKRLCIWCCHDGPLFKWPSTTSGATATHGRKSQQLAQHLFYSLTQSKDQVYIGDVEEMLDEFTLSHNTEIEDGSIEEGCEGTEVTAINLLTGFALTI